MRSQPRQRLLLQTPNLAHHLPRFNPVERVVVKAVLTRSAVHAGQPGRGQGGAFNDNRIDPYSGMSPGWGVGLPVCFWFLPKS